MFAIVGGVFFRNILGSIRRMKEDLERKFRKLRGSCAERDGCNDGDQDGLIFKYGTGQFCWKRRREVGFAALTLKTAVEWPA